MRWSVESDIYLVMDSIKETHDIFFSHCEKDRILRNSIPEKLSVTFEYVRNTSNDRSAVITEENKSRREENKQDDKAVNQQ